MNTTRGLPSYNETKICITSPLRIQSFGLWRGDPRFPRDENHNWLSYALPRIELTIGLLFVCTQAFHFSLKRFGLPLYTSQLLAGLMLSPAVIGQTAFDMLVTEETIQGIGTFSTFGYAGFLFLSGVKLDPSMVTRVSKRALYIGLLAIIPPLVVTVIILQNFIVNGLLGELKIINSELGKIAQSSAIVSDFLSLFVFVTANLMKKAPREALDDLIIIFVFVGFVFMVVRPALKSVVKSTPEGKPIDYLYLAIVVLLFMSSVGMSVWYMRFRFLGAYILGLAIPHGPPMGSLVVEKLESMITHLFLPLLFTTSGMRVEKLFVVLSNHTLILNAHTTAIALTVKFAACLLPPLYTNIPLKDASSLALIMCSLGTVELTGFVFLSDIKVIDADMYALMFYVILNVSSIVPMLVKVLYDPSRKYAGYQKRNLIDLKPHSDLPVVACIHVPDDVSAVIHLLDVAYPSRENHVVVNVLHLIKLRGQSTPVFISHDKERTTSFGDQYSCSFENILLSFGRFERVNWGAVSVNTFTSVSSPDFMQEDICSLAFDKSASLIILPFHRRWYLDGGVEQENKFIRSINSRVLEKSPCSVGILLDRGNKMGRVHDPSSEPQYNVAVIFIGGSDDREALTFAKRMAQNPKVSLTVVHLLPGEIEEKEDWGTVVDTVILRDMETDGYINYIEKEVAGGSETATMLHSMINKFNLIIVGRRANLKSPQTSGLNEWSEFPELGALGDLLASKDYSARCSVLIVQQQHTTQSSTQ
ncbi:hypothetical protein Patl1_34003 [Pistacia atlantica]|uniref:Uncharacterized protein n=1 Tax=Pistacia atlantica TaxID=434234 RepID=A0ACC0ZTB3_9ROSI|nr:hypothetical protein Patl1_34003 [Pistacia atlantica]